MTQQQQRGIDSVRALLERRDCRNEGQYRSKISKFEVSMVGDTAFVSAKVEYDDSVREDSMLRVLDWRYWLFRVGPRGGVTVLSCPKSEYQFNGQYAFGMYYRLGQVAQRGRKS